MVREISTLNKKIDDLRNLMKVVLDANEFTQPVTTQQRNAVSVGSSKYKGIIHKLCDISREQVCFIPPG